MTSKRFNVAKNYYSLEADRRFMSCSQFDSFKTCEAREAAYLKGEYVKPETTSPAYTLGSYFHTALEGKKAHEAFIEAHADEIFYKSAGKGKKADFVLADEMVETAKSDPIIGRFVKAKGENEKTLTGYLFGTIPWRVRLDKYLTTPERVILEWKTVSNIYERYFGAAGYESFIRHWGYDRRAAVYLEIEKQNAGEVSDAVFLICAISKQSPHPDKQIFHMNSRPELDICLDEMKEDAMRFWRIKQGELAPKRCERCDYCRATRDTTPRVFTELDEEIIK